MNIGITVIVQQRNGHILIRCCYKRMVTSIFKLSDKMFE